MAQAGSVGATSEQGLNAQGWIVGPALHPVSVAVGCEVSPVCYSGVVVSTVREFDVRFHVKAGEQLEFELHLYWPLGDAGALPVSVCDASVLLRRSSDGAVVAMWTYPLLRGHSGYSWAYDVPGDYKVAIFGRTGAMVYTLSASLVG